MLTIVLTGGGSGGHITPLLSLAHALKKGDPECHIVYIGLKGEKLEGLQERYGLFDEVRFVPSGKFRRYHGQSALAHLTDIKSLALNGRDFFKVSAGVLAARAELKRLKPDVVFSKGGFVAVPVGIAAHQLGIPIITHDSDAIPGLANRIIGKWAKIHAVGQTPENYNYPKESIHYTGIPVDERIQAVSAASQKAFKAELGLPADSVVLLVSGGGLGSGLLNDLVAVIAPELLAKIPSLQIINITGDQHKADVQAKYNQIAATKGRIEVLGFSADFYKYSGAADLIITRAGATVLAEFAIQKKALVVIPAAQLTGGHQLENARALKTAGAAEVVDSEIEPAKLLTVLLDLLQNQQRRAELGAKLGTLAQPDAADKLAAIILETANAGANP